MSLNAIRRDAAVKTSEPEGRGCDGGNKVLGRKASRTLTPDGRALTLRAHPVSV